MKKILVFLLLVVCMGCLCACTQIEWPKSADTQEDEQGSGGSQCDDEFADMKPVIYLYPIESTEVNVKLDYEGTLTCTYPMYDSMTGWNVTAYPSGILEDDCGKEYNYLYWEGTRDVSYDFGEGFCVAGEDTADFLENALEELGLNRKEANEFIVYWLPFMQNNPYNIISFQKEAYTEGAALNITPKPDTTIRVFMAWKAADEWVDLPKQSLTAPKREGFTVVEWGGCEVK